MFILCILLYIIFVVVFLFKTCCDSLTILILVVFCISDTLHGLVFGLVWFRLFPNGIPAHHNNKFFYNYKLTNFTTQKKKKKHTQYNNTNVHDHASVWERIEPFASLDVQPMTIQVQKVIYFHLNLLMFQHQKRNHHEFLQC